MATLKKINLGRWVYKIAWGHKEQVSSTEARWVTDVVQEVLQADYKKYLKDNNSLTSPRAGLKTVASSTGRIFDTPDGKIHDGEACHLPSTPDRPDQMIVGIGNNEAVIIDSNRFENISGTKDDPTTWTADVKPEFQDKIDFNLLNGSTITR